MGLEKDQVLSNLFCISKKGKPSHSFIHLDFECTFSDERDKDDYKSGTKLSGIK